MNYSNPYYTPQTMPQAPQGYQMPQNGLVWVDGELAAREYLIAPNAAVALWDSSAPAVYLKQADASGRPTFRAFDLVERSAQPKPAPVEYATKADLEELAKAVNRMELLCYTPKYAKEEE